MIKSFYKNTRLLILSFILIFAWGIFSYQTLPRQEDPELISRTAVVLTPFPGASAERVEALVTEVLESEIAEIEEVGTIQSDSRMGFSTVSVELVDAVENAQPVWSKVRDEMADYLYGFWLDDRFKYTHSANVGNGVDYCLGVID